MEYSMAFFPIYESQFKDIKYSQYSDRFKENLSALVLAENSSSGGDYGRRA
jgi:hypothetical protein